jgi:hypothetical protein
MSKELRGIKGKEAIRAFLRAGGVERPGKGSYQYKNAEWFDCYYPW